jgi:negative regulator of sigma E activity
MKTHKLDKTKGSARLLYIIIAALLAIALLVFSWLKTGKEREVTPPPPFMEPALFQREVAPVLAQHQASNEVAISQLRKRINANFRKYQSGARKFAEDITSWKSRYHIVTKGTHELFSKDNEKVERYVTEVFQRDVVSAKELKRDIKKVLEQFHQDVFAARNVMLSDVEAVVLNYPELSQGSGWLEANTNFIRYVEQEVDRVSKDAAVDGTQLGIATVVAGVAVEEVVRITTIWALQKLATSMAATAATSGGTTATTTGTGGAAGTLAGPAGTAIGIGVGLIVGGVIDWWMTDRLQDKLEDQTLSFLRGLQAAMIEDKQGVVHILGEELRLADERYEQVIYSTLVGGEIE